VCNTIETPPPSLRITEASNNNTKYIEIVQQEMPRSHCLVSGKHIQYYLEIVQQEIQQNSENAKNEKMIKINFKVGQIQESIYYL
jgi:hypothetical protein